MFRLHLIHQQKAIEAGISVYNRSKGKPIVNSADAAGRIENIDLAAANDAIVIALCNGEGIAKDNDERMMYCQMLLERGMEHGMDASDLWFDPLFLVVKGMQDKQMEVLEAIKMFSDMGLNFTGGLSNNSNGMPKNIRPIMDSALVAGGWRCRVLHPQLLTLTTFVLWKQSNPAMYSRATPCMLIPILNCNYL